ncbi:Glucose 1-dehydrogenase [Arcticibacter svalbardensis MN12-7]|uniref:Glucose 1-dehydrogenase n=1 Tax=Arcticibacter svalbardensis MN12-7 TaxID=1150600 RepID=R9GN79_9SPHI|nr:SDR family oxidoreductase [Arcticibacter svalbardensis]EOR93297.1 Glucose 1-dehydrogenase [Arcticibacter svalbardensis MN12-7]
MSLEVIGQTVLVTGASSGIGQGIAIEFGKQGANVVVNYHSDEDGAKYTLEQIIRAGGKGFIHKANVGKEEEVVAMFNKAVDEYGTLDVLINNAGIQKDSEFSSMTLDQWNMVINTNLTGQFLCAREAIQLFESKKESFPEGKAIGNIIFISSVHDIIPWACHVNYASSKGGILMLMKSLALEVAPKKIRINGISPGAIATDINDDVWNDDEKKNQLLKLIPYKRIGLPEDIAKVAVWLASGDSDYITGTTIYVDGGMTLYPGFVDNG